MIKKNDNNINSQFAIDVAQGFYNTGISLAKHSSNDKIDSGYIWIPPGVVNLSFATELLLKATLYYDLRKKSWGHKLFDLYNSLSNETKLKIQNQYIKHRQTNEDEKLLPSYKIVVSVNNKDKTTKSIEENSDFNEIKNLLKIHSEAFEDWRYLYEFGEEGYNYEFDFKAMDAFYKSLIDILKEFLAKNKRTYGMNKIKK
jgi:HEPN domain-containing protein